MSWPCLCGHTHMVGEVQRQACQRCGCAFYVPEPDDRAEDAFTRDDGPYDPSGERRYERWLGEIAP